MVFSKINDWFVSFWNNFYCLGRFDSSSDGLYTEKSISSSINLLMGPSINQFFD